ncbi:MAG TPA: glycoside hydrolase family 36 protein, partial [Balneolaceae bacterium]|nr:glycoside hydrolase family 36 protein [Balneolaceae bacterium]
MKIQSSFFLLLIAVFTLSACSSSNSPTIQSGDLTLSYNELLHTTIHFDKARQPLVEGFQSSEILRTGKQVLSDFRLTGYHTEQINNKIGHGKRLIVEGVHKDNSFQIEKKVIATAYDAIPNFISTKVIYRNTGDKKVPVEGWNNNRYTLLSIPAKNEQKSFWSFQSGTYPSRPDWVLPVGNDFYQKNYQGMNSSDYGGGTPVLDVWRPDAGIAVGHVDLEPQLISLPVNSKAVPNGVRIAVKFDVDSVSQKKAARFIAPGDSMSTLETFVYAHTGDYYTSLEAYRKIIESKGVTFADPTETAYEPVWCAWGYGRDFTVEQVINTLPKVKELGFEWVVLDDGWQIAEGDWRPNSKFDEISMKEFVDIVHSYGLKAKLWWAPLAADPGSKIHEERSDMLLVNQSGDYQKITWWDSHYLNPALDITKEYHKKLVEKFMKEWGFDGLKIDGQHLNQVPADYGHPKRQKYPEESIEELPDLYKVIYKTAKDIQSNAVVEICPCGTSASSFIMPYMNQPVSSDPLSSWQIRLKGKTYKALMGDNAAYYGDHVELSDNQSDFASTVGVGGVIGTKFTWPKYSGSDNEFLLTSEREKWMAKWVDIYKQYMLPKGTYRGELY